MPKTFDYKIGKILDFFNCTTNHETRESGVHGTDYLQYYNLFCSNKKKKRRKNFSTLIQVTIKRPLIWKGVCCKTEQNAKFSKNKEEKKH